MWLALLSRGVVRHEPGLVLGVAVALGLSSTLMWLLRVVSTRVQRRFRDRVTISLERHVALLQASVPTVAHQERPEYLDRLAVLRDQVFVLDHVYMSLFSTCGWVPRLAATLGLLASIDPRLVALALFALPAAATSGWRPAVERRARELGAEADRLARHLFTLSTTASSAKELRVLGVGAQVARRRRQAWERWYSLTAAARWSSAGWHTLAWTVFGAGYVVAVALVAAGPGASPAAVLLVLAAGARLSGYVGATVGEIGLLRGIWMDGSRRLAWLGDYAAAQATGREPAPRRLREGIRLVGCP